MHEMSIAVDLLKNVLSAVAEHGGGRIEKIEVTTGAFRQVVPEMLCSAFEVIAEGTLAAGAELKVTQEAVRAQCRNCGRSFACEAWEFLCPGCGQADVEIVAGYDIILQSIVCEKQEAPAEP